MLEQRCETGGGEHEDPEPHRLHQVLGPVPPGALEHVGLDAWTRSYASAATSQYTLIAPRAVVRRSMSCR